MNATRHSRMPRVSPRAPVPPRPAAALPTPAWSRQRVPQSERRCACGGGCPHCRSGSGRDTPPGPATPVAAPSVTAHEGDGILPGGVVHPEVSATIASRRGGGAALPDAIREEMALVLGDRVFDVRVHADTWAGALARSLGARAFTTGRDVFFGDGQYRPESSIGKRLLAHELTHVVQQRGVPQVGEMVVSEPGDTLELDAESVAETITSGSDRLEATHWAVEGITRPPSAGSVPGLERSADAGVTPMSAARRVRRVVLAREPSIAGVGSIVGGRGLAPSLRYQIAAEHRGALVTTLDRYVDDNERRARLQRVAGNRAVVGGLYRATFTPGVKHDHAPSGRWAEIQKEPNSGFWANRACANFSPNTVVKLAVMKELGDKPLALAHLSWYLGAFGADFVEDQHLERLLHTDAAVAWLIVKRIPWPRPHAGTQAGSMKVEQGDYVNQDFRFSFGAIDRLDFEFDWSAGTVHVWFQDRYEWHPVYPGLYTKFSDDEARETNCVHAALVEMKLDGASDFWMKGDATLRLRDLVIAAAAK